MRKVLEYRGKITYWSCAECGARRHLTVHHLDENPNNNASSNLQVLCVSCHEKLHGVKRKTKINKKYQAGTSKRKRKC
jgi:NAD-dependent SIR2 family protein deacetylase